MGRLEKALVLGALTYMVIYIPFFILFAVTALGTGATIDVILPFHITAAVLNLIALVLTFRDLYLRDMPSPNDKLTWGVLILMTSGVGLFAYVFKHALKPRPHRALDEETGAGQQDSAWRHGVD